MNKNKVERNVRKERVDRTPPAQPTFDSKNNSFD